MRERAAAKWTRENSQEKKLRLWARREGAAFEVPGRKPTGRSGNLNRRVQTRRDSENPPTRSAGGHLCSPAKPFCTTADPGVHHEGWAQEEMAAFHLFEENLRHYHCLVCKEAWPLSAARTTRTMAWTWKCPTRTKRPQRRGGTVNCTKVPHKSIYRNHGGQRGIKGHVLNLPQGVHCSFWNGQREWPANLGYREARCRWVSLKYIDIYKYTIISVLLACIFLHFGVKTLSACTFTLHPYSVYGREFEVKCEWYPPNNLTRVLFCSSKYILFLRTCKFNTTEGHLSKYIFPAILDIIDCFASKYMIILFLLIVRITANTIQKHGVDQLEQSVDTPDIYYCNIDCCNSNTVLVHQLQFTAVFTVRECECSV